MNGPLPEGHPANLTQLWEALESTSQSLNILKTQGSQTKD
jgi:hypothetical protein